MSLFVAAFVVVGFPAGALAGPGEDEYVLEIPGPKGPKGVNPGGPDSSKQDSLTPAGGQEPGASGTAAGSGSALDELLALAATSSDLGAPESSGERGGAAAASSDGTAAGDSDDAAGSIFAVASDAAGGGSGPLVLAGLVLGTIAVGLWAVRARRRADGDA